MSLSLILIKLERSIKWLAYQYGGENEWELGWMHICKRHMMAGKNNYKVFPVKL
jgi:hypothetical protein